MYSQIKGRNKTLIRHDLYIKKGLQLKSHAQGLEHEVCGRDSFESSSGFRNFFETVAVIVNAYILLTFSSNRRNFGKNAKLRAFYRKTFYTWEPFLPAKVGNPHLFKISPLLIFSSEKI